ncbi:MAG: hypothetical protein JRE81_08660, partial [Deltaproteobacteria bacterium]|nr:hypothetical protein [Deltaproteobacteria bacterium]
MHTTMFSRLRRPAISALILASALSLVSVSSGQTETVEEPQSIAAQIQELVAALDARRAELDELAKEVDKSLDRANAAMMQNEISARREKYRRDVASLV